MSMKHLNISFVVELVEDFYFYFKRFLYLCYKLQWKDGGTFPSREHLQSQSSRDGKG
jgi:hypothetical protein